MEQHHPISALGQWLYGRRIACHVQRSATDAVALQTSAA